MSAPAPDVLRVLDIGAEVIGAALARFGVRLQCLPAQADIPGSYWGETEAGLVGDNLYVRLDTPVHSALHEAGHFICMDAGRRAGLDRDAGGDFDEENAVCYLQSLLADALPGVGRRRMWQDMDAWGYTFRLGSAQAWFECDAQECAAWLQGHGIVDEAQRITWHKRDEVTAESGA